MIVHFRDNYWHDCTF